MSWNTFGLYLENIIFIYSRAAWLTSIGHIGLEIANHWRDWLAVFWALSRCHHPVDQKWHFLWVLVIVRLSHLLFLRLFQWLGNQFPSCLTSWVSSNLFLLRVQEAAWPSGAWFEIWRLQVYVLLWPWSWSCFSVDLVQLMLVNSHLVCLFPVVVYSWKNCFQFW